MNRSHAALLGTNLAANACQKNNDLVIEASMPGIRPEDVDVNVSGRTLTIKAERKEAKEAKEEDYYYREVTAGRFFRQLTLPADVQADKADAQYEHGMLRLRLPLGQAAKEVPIKVKAIGHSSARRIHGSVDTGVGLLMLHLPPVGLQVHAQNRIWVSV